MTQRAEAEQTQRREEESSVQQSSANFPTSAVNEHLPNDLLTCAEAASSGGRHCETTRLRAGVARGPRDPFNFHVYVGFLSGNGDVMQPIIEALKSDWNLLFCLPCDRQIAVAMKEVSLCEKCLLYVTPECTGDPWFQAVVTAALEKARLFSRDMLIVLRDPRLTAEDLNQLNLQEFKATAWPPDSNDMPDLLAQLLLWLLQDFALAPIPRSPEKISGYCEAFAYYYAYLNHILRYQRDKMNDLWLKINRRAQVVLPMLIVVPESCRAPPAFSIEGKLATLPLHEVVDPGDRGGKKNVEFKRSVMELVIDAERNEVIYFTGEFPGCLRTVWETHRAGEAGLTEQDLNRISADFYRTLQSLLCHPDNRHCVDQYRLVLWQDASVDLYDFLLPIVRRVANERDASSLVCGRQDGGNRLPESSFHRLESVNDLTTLWSGHQPYAMRDVTTRGICLVVDSISDATQSAVDIQKLRSLFVGEFRFEVRLHRDREMTWDQLESLLCDVAQNEDHSNHDAFVCCMVTRGRLDRVLMPDGICHSTVSLTNIFSYENCATLRGKPKLFLTQTIDDGTTDDLLLDDNETQVQYVCFLLYIVRYMYYLIWAPA